MVSLKRFDGSEFLTSDELEIKQEIFDRYKYALLAIGVDFSNESVQNALINCHYGFEEALQATIAYWYWLKERDEQFHPNATLSVALRNNWSNKYWKDKYLNNPAFKNQRDLLWDELGEHLGYGMRNQTIANIIDDSNELCIEFYSGRVLTLSQVKRKGWNWFKEYVQEQVNQKAHSY